MPCLNIRLPGFRRQARRIDSAFDTTSLPEKVEDLLDKPTNAPLRFAREQSISHGHQFPLTQRQLLISAPKEPYKLIEDAVIPQTSSQQEAVIRIQTIGLNPIDWKSPAFDFGLPSLPCILGREYIGIVVKAPAHSSRIRTGDFVLATSTDYRDYRKAAFQEYAVASAFNLCRLPVTADLERCASLGVAFVTAALSLGLCLGLRFPGGPDLLSLARKGGRDSLPEDVRDECHAALASNERLKAGDWLAIWGAGSTVGYFVLQLAKMAGVRVACVADIIKRGALLSDAGADAPVHRAHTDEASSILRAITRDNLHYGIDTVGKDTGGLLQDTLSSKKGGRAHIVGLTGLPSSAPGWVVQHKVPIKLFHERPDVGEGIMLWLETLLSTGKLMPPEVDVHPSEGLDAVNGALARLRDGDLYGHRIVVRLGEVQSGRTGAGDR